MSEGKPLKVIFCWHMHQPEYRNLASAEYQLPWTYLHALKDYVDMASHLEACPEAKAVINFGPILLDQIEDYAAQVSRFFDSGVAIRDPLLAALNLPVLPAEQEKRVSLIKACLRANEDRVISRYPAFRRLADMAQWILDDYATSTYINNQFLVDLVTWYHLVWLGETVRRENPQVAYLIRKASGFSLHERRSLTRIVGDLLQNILTRYRRLADSGQIELSMSPSGHPILPLVIDLACAREALPDVLLPSLERYPGGRERIEWHIEQGKRTFEDHFGSPPQGCWPSEGGVSDATVAMLANAGFSWIASGEGVLYNSLVQGESAPDPDDKSWLYRMYRDEGSDMGLFFRDDSLSDLIGFTYASWHADDAVANFIHRLEEIAEACRDQQDAVVTIIMDGENAWEYYPENGYHFLNALYQRLVEHAGIELTTFSEFHAANPDHPRLPNLVAGSWVYGNFATWIGDEEKNRAWDILGDVKRAFDYARRTRQFNDERLRQIERQLAVCEGSDWFWWFGEYNPAETVSDFESLFRQHVANLYQLMAMEPPQYLSQTLSRGRGTPAMGGVIRPGREK
ncbi:MAG: glycoside hydrolase family 57 protein [Pseudomonadales bacterium]|nr:glycoside hydrolase family 57 protein [Pseudomonadales bacterium]MDP7359673.1 glycoside hydrolase family 57 protein [Pseudomonadales bacterium]MDP7595142.1 glycoside hydrolase family 57 protein [Pseudomonadales bacterium]